MDWFSDMAGNQFFDSQSQYATLNQPGSLHITDSVHINWDWSVDHFPSFPFFWMAAIHLVWLRLDCVICRDEISGAHQSVTSV
jgi:hypothetical protein